MMDLFKRTRWLRPLSTRCPRGRFRRMALLRFELPALPQRRAASNDDTGLRIGRRGLLRPRRGIVGAWSLWLVVRFVSTAATWPDVAHVAFAVALHDGARRPD